MEIKEEDRMQNAKQIEADFRKLKIRRYFTKAESPVFDSIEWKPFTAEIKNADGKVIFQQTDVEAPNFWSQTAVNITASKYFHGGMGDDHREYSMKQLVGRVANTITDWGWKDSYFETEQDRDNFRDELTHLLIYQYGSFNSPVWFNCGVEPKPQCSACFINSIKDSMDSILNLAKIEGMLFKYGSGTGTNLSPLRSSKERLSTGGTASGPVSFMRGFDAFAGVIKSGGKTRRAAKMVILDVSHPDIMEFINSKIDEEEKAHALIREGYDPSFGGDAYRSVFFQNANHSVRVSDGFMKAVKAGEIWETRAITSGDVVDQYKAKEVLHRISYGTWFCGDPGLQFDDTVNTWHTCKTTDRIYASNPCSEFMFLNDTACNLASINLMKYYDPDSGRFNIEAFKHTCDIFITAQEIIVDNASYPREEIQKNSSDFRPLGLGYTNLGALLMAMGHPYDSDRGRAHAAAITAIMTGEAYLQSARIAQAAGPFSRYEENRTPMLEVMRMHRDAANQIRSDHAETYIREAAVEVWDHAVTLGEQFGYRNSQTTVLAPTGTISFMMDCDTTGIEPDLALVKYKSMVDTGMIRIVNQTLPMALRKLGYTSNEIEEIVQFVEKDGTVEGCPHLKDEDLPVFDCAFKPARGSRFIHHMGHIKMMAAVQPFISGAISKTVNVPTEATVEDIMDAYVQAWELGLKAIAIYRDGSKSQQPLSTTAKSKKDEKADAPVIAFPNRKKLPEERKAITHKFDVGGHEGYITVGMYDDGKPGEIFLTIAKEGSTISGVMDSLATSVSIGLQYGVPLKTFIDKFAHVRFEPAGMTRNHQIPFAKSIVDYIFRWLASKFLVEEDQQHYGVLPARSDRQLTLFSEAPKGDKVYEEQSDAPPCPECGAIMVRSGACYKCNNCGATSGCG
ncbi:MAG TPA: vitamin B12-dependent ribonucleotide reductase [Thermoanaerobaculia bacterium]|nr:vitamin B12-dependent ribonucleotide reductase [Thermoanaerobaculia bacterium]HUM31066.1 vitamin B12-dependent ribonucleotide reductase [Thermoanaerobaculia bacterium]HXK69364.1 vitamin B12-dependent ribonucleotide reductase [Thermoanaerobaculia bacterium]